MQIEGFERDKAHPWNAQLDFYQTYQRLAYDLEHRTVIDKNGTHKMSDEEVKKQSILVLALINGMRIHESVITFNKFQQLSAEDIKSRRANNKNGVIDIQVPVEKRGYIREYEKDENGHIIYYEEKHTNRRTGEQYVIKRKKVKSRDWKPYYRWVAIPDIILHKIGEYKGSDMTLWYYSMKFYGWNPHSLRYAYITERSKTDQPQMIAKVTGQATLNLILGYTGDLKAKELHDNFVKKVVENGE